MQATSLDATRETLEALSSCRPATPADPARGRARRRRRRQRPAAAPRRRARDARAHLPGRRPGYGIDWRVLAAINLVETGLGTNTHVSSAGAVGWMQFMPATWRAYGRDASGDGIADPYDPYDAIYSAANYLEAAGARTDIARAMPYNHADWWCAARPARNLPDRSARLR